MSKNQNSTIKQDKQGTSPCGRAADSDQLIKWAKRYFKRGLSVTLCQPGTSEPIQALDTTGGTITSISQFKRLARSCPDANLAIVTGDDVNTMAIKVDSECFASLELYEVLEERLGKLPETMQQLENDGQQLRLFRSRDPKCMSWEDRLGPGIRCYGAGSFFLVAPSIVGGKAAKWEQKCEPVDLPDKWSALFRAAAEFPSAEEVSDGTEIVGRARIPSLYALAFRLKLGDVSPEEALLQVAAVNHNQCKPSVAGDHLLRVLRRVFNSNFTRVQLPSVSRLPTRPVPKTITLAEIGQMKFKPLVWALKRLLPTGVALLAGPPKLGKSLLTLQAALAVASGARLWKKREPEKSGRVLYIAYEENLRRLRSRSTRLLKGAPIPGNLSVNLAWNRMDRGGIEDIENWLRVHPNTRLVVVDTLAKFRPEKSDKRSVYDFDYAVSSALVKIAERHNVAIVLVHHTAKGSRTNILESINGTNGLPAGADTVLVLSKGKGVGEAELYLTGRDVREKTLSLKRTFNHGWLSLGNSEDHNRSAARRLILEVLRTHGPLKPGQIAEKLNKKAGSIRGLLLKMVAKGEVTCGKEGLYSAV